MMLLYCVYLIVIMVLYKEQKLNTKYVCKINYISVTKNHYSEHLLLQTIYNIQQQNQNIVIVANPPYGEMYIIINNNKKYTLPLLSLYKKPGTIIYKYNDNVITMIITSEPNLVQQLGLDCIFIFVQNMVDYLLLYHLTEKTVV